MDKSKKHAGHNHCVYKIIELLNIEVIMAWVIAGIMAWMIVTLILAIQREIGN